MTIRGVGLFLLLFVPVLFWHLLFNTTGKDAYSTTRELVKEVNAAQQNSEGDPERQAKLPEKRAEFYARYRVPAGGETPGQRAQFELLWSAIAACQTPQVSYLPGSSGKTEPLPGKYCYTQVRGSGTDGDPVSVTLGWTAHKKRWFLSAYRVGQGTPMPLVATR